MNFRSLYEQYAQDVYRFSLYLCGDTMLAEDITAETFVRVWVTPGEIRVGTVKAYLFMIARNLYRTELKRATRYVELQDSVPDGEPGPESALSLQWELRAVLKALQKLPEIDRAVLLMHVQDGMPYAEIGAVLGLTVAAVKVKVHRSRVQLHRFQAQERDLP